MKKISIILIIAFLIIILLSYIVYDKGYIFKKEDNNIKDNTPQEKEITDEDLIKTLNEKLDYLSNLDTDEVKSQPSIFNQNTQNSDLTDEQKITSILYTLVQEESNFEEYSNEEYNEVFPEITASGLTKEDFPKISANIVLEKVEEIYGEKPTNTKIDTVSCPTYNYNEKYNAFYIGSQCGGSYSNIARIYPYKYTQKEDSLYIYVSVGLIEFNSNLNEFIFYTNYDRKTEYQKSSSLNDLQITSSNYQEFTKYKIKFIKKDNNYIFDSTENIK